VKQTSLSKLDSTLVPAPRHPRSLRLRLVLWYSTLLTLALGAFALLTLFLTTDAITRSVDNALSAEARVVSFDASRELSPTPPYWPKQLELPVINTYSEPGVVIEIVDLQGQLRYLTATSTTGRIPSKADITQAARTGQTRWYTTTVSGEHVRVAALPMRAPLADASGKAGDTVSTDVNANDAVSGNGPVIGVLFVAKSLRDVDTTLLVLRTLLLSSGLITLIGTLVGSWLLATRVLRPLTELMRTARSIVASTDHGRRPGNLNQRVRSPGGHDEMAQVVETFNEMLASLESASQTQRRFIADASHELRAPLTTIQGNLAFLQRHGHELPSQERQIMLSDAHQETLRLAQLVEELLLLARADASLDTPLHQTPETDNISGKSKQQMPPVELDRAVLQLVRQLRRRLSAEDSKLKLEVGHIEPVRVHGDEENLRRILLILLDNAIKYTSVNTEKETGCVSVSLEKQDGQAALRVRDTGIGIDPSDLPYIFERFYRADRARSRQGTGLGLSIAQTLVEQLGGHMTAESTLGKGSTFTVWLPLSHGMRNEVVEGGW
jgi:two-component system, OmpR family, sensor kinase